MNLIGSSTFCFQIPGDILLQRSQNQYHLTELIAYPIDLLPYGNGKLANLSFVLKKYIFFTSYLIIES